MNDHPLSPIERCIGSPDVSLIEISEAFAELSGLREKAAVLDLLEAIPDYAYVQRQPSGEWFAYIAEEWSEGILHSYAGSGSTLAEVLANSPVIKIGGAE